MKVVTAGNPERTESMSLGRGSNKLVPLAGQYAGSVLSFGQPAGDEVLQVYAKIIKLVGMLSLMSKDIQMMSLAQAILSQKIGRINSEVDTLFVQEVSNLGLCGSEREFNNVIRLLNSIQQALMYSGEDERYMSLVFDSRMKIAETMDCESPFFMTFVSDILNNIVNIGHTYSNEKMSDMISARIKIRSYYKILARLLSSTPNIPLDFDRVEVSSLFRDAWINLAIHEILVCPDDPALLAATDFDVVAKYSPVLVSHEYSHPNDSFIDLNVVLLRGASRQSITNYKRFLESRMDGFWPRKFPTYPQLAFLSATWILELARSRQGNCSNVLKYFEDPAVYGSNIFIPMVSIANNVLNSYFETFLRPWQSSRINNREILSELSKVFVACAHRVKAVRLQAMSFADRMIEECPGLMAHKKPIFTLLEIISGLWDGVLNEESDEYEPRTRFTSILADFTLELPDVYENRREAMENMTVKVRHWLDTARSIAPVETRKLLGSYVAHSDGIASFNHLSYGRSIAVEIGGTRARNIAAIPSITDWKHARAQDFISEYASTQKYTTSTGARTDYLSLEISDVRERADHIRNGLLKLRSRANKTFIPIEELRESLREAGSFAITYPMSMRESVNLIVEIPFLMFNYPAIEAGISLWLWILNEAPVLHLRLINAITRNWEWSIRKGLGFFNDQLDWKNPFSQKMEYKPSEKAESDKVLKTLQKQQTPHLLLLEMLTSHFRSNFISSASLIAVYLRAVLGSIRLSRQCSKHVLSREFRFGFYVFATEICTASNLPHEKFHHMSNEGLNWILRWFSLPPLWTFGGNRMHLKSVHYAMTSVLKILKNAEPSMINGYVDQAKFQSSGKETLLRLLIADEIMRVETWLNPQDFSKRNKASKDTILGLLNVAWSIDPDLAVSVYHRFKSAETSKALQMLLVDNPGMAASSSRAIEFLLQECSEKSRSNYLLYWTPVDPISAINFFLPDFGNDPLLLQYAMRSLESHHVDITFFYVPQLVQTLRTDAMGYVKRYIFETAMLSQLFAHQILWNMDANAYKDENSELPDSLKPTLDAITERLKSAFSGDDRLFYEREFNFFGEITSISGKLRPFLKRPKAEKKQKIAEELRKIKVEVGVYLPSNPDGVVVGIDRKSGKPLQSHAKAPFMATFRIKQVPPGTTVEDVEAVVEEVEQHKEPREVTERWQAAIFKVGDDCRQDMLALQLVAAFRNIFNSVGLSLYVYPYRVTSTAPGCGIIDVLPNSISRDMLGREAVNGLYEYFISTYGHEDTVAFQLARNNFVKSMAAYSVISYLLQFKDRHNGNIMLDEAGHILHIGKIG